MYFFIATCLIIVLIPNKLEKNYNIILYLKIFLVSLIYFYLLNKNNILVLTLLSYIIICILIYRLFSNSLIKKEESNTLFHLAHEVKNPIAVSKGYLDMLDINNKERLEKYIPIIKSEIKRALTIMDDFLDLKRIKINKELMDVTLLIDDIGETIKLVFDDKNINFEIKNIDKELIIDGDYDKLKQVIMNLLKNSYEASSKNIKLMIELDKDLKIKIIDDGIGISKEDINKICEVFYTTKPCGTGIGVSLSKEIIQLHNGSLIYESELNKGTIATISLPIKFIF